ncbi:MAG: Rpn family recombination-promoting nuclease/putative transposase [Fibromonadaceae bacterium]|nr:Rpn family recombination-promoting nuclease/putative transposase [Fibromonadaceae bacterium]
MAFVVLPKFKVALEECETTLDIWLWLFNNLHKLDEIPVRFRQGMFRGVFELAEISNFSKEELRAYEASMKEIAVYNATIAYAKKEGEQVGFGRGVKEGREELFSLWESGVSLAEAKQKFGIS